MVWRFFVTLLIASTAWGEEGFRISKVVGEEKSGTSRLELKSKDDGKAEVIFVEDEPIVTSADIKSAWPDPVSTDTIAIQMSDAGAPKLAAATADPSGLRLALVVDGRVLMAPVVRVQLGRNFQISGLQEFTDDERLSYALRIEGKSREEVKAAVEEMRKQREEIVRMPRVEPVYYTEEEYAQLKATREKAGIYFSDEIPTKESLDKNLRKGMPEAEVIGVYGKPRWRKRQADGATLSFRYVLADEKRPKERKMVREDFIVEFENGKVIHWKQSSWSDRIRASKGKEERAPKRAIYPPHDPSDPDLDILKFFEETKITGDRSKLSLTEAGELLGSLYMLSRPEAGSREMIASDCDGMVAVAANFPDVKELVANSPGGKVPLAKLHEVLEPYTTGKKEFPDHLLKTVR